MESNSKNSIKKIIRNISLFAILIILTYYFIFKKIDRKGIQVALSHTNIIFILIAIIVSFGYIFFEALNHYRNLKYLKEDTTLSKCIYYAIIGFFFSGVTPAATGGQPFQIYYMHKDNISYTHATICILIQSFSYLLSIILIGLIGYIVNFNYISSLGFFEYFFFMGIIVNGAILSISLIAMFNRTLSKKILNFVYKIIDKFNHEKAVNFQEKVGKQLDEYHDSAKFIMNNKENVIKTILTSIMQAICNFSVAYFVYLALGVHHLNYLKIMLLQSVLHLSVSVLPLPGTVGVNETGFTLLYKPIIMANIADSAMLLTRGISFYLLILLTGIIILVNNIKTKKTDNK